MESLHLTPYTHLQMRAEIVTQTSTVKNYTHSRGVFQEREGYGGGMGGFLGANASSSFDFRFPPFITNHR